MKLTIINSRFLAILSGLVLCLVSPFGKAHAQDVRAAIVAAEKEFDAAYAKGDIKALGTLYAPDAQILVPDGDIIKGRPAIEAAMVVEMAAGGRKMSSKTIEAEGHGDWAYETGTYVITGASGKVDEDGKSMAIWKQIDGRWRIFLEIYNSADPTKKK